MSWLYRNLVRPALFTQDSEEIHNRTLAALGWAARHELIREAASSFFSPAELPVELFGLRFPNPVGLAAGLDKHAAAVPFWPALGFGFCELGGVTWHPQAGNPAPRMFRAIEDGALINRMGFNNAGAEALAVKLKHWRDSGRWPKHPVAINLGKSKITPLDKAANDYASSFKALWPHADFFVVNVSSPNTPNLRQLQDKSALDEILAALQQVNASMVESAAPGTARPRPILVKVAPDLAYEALDEILELTTSRQIAGIVATNTTISRPETPDADLKRIYSETGGLSGKPLRQRSTEVIRHLSRQTNGRLPIIGVGGIFNASDAWEKITAGAALVQIYTGLVYEGPGVVKAIVEGLRDRLSDNHLGAISDAIGRSQRSGS
jgi:dihydroorotate dehydrogenase